MKQPRNSGLASTAEAESDPRLAQSDQKPSQPTLLEVVDAFRDEMLGLRREMYEIARKGDRFDRAFQSMFREEAESRLQLRKDQGDCASPRYSPLDRLRDRLEKESVIRERG